MCWCYCQVLYKFANNLTSVIFFLISRYKKDHPDEKRDPYDIGEDGEDWVSNWTLFEYSHLIIWFNRLSFLPLTWNRVFLYSVTPANKLSSPELCFVPGGQALLFDTSSIYVIGFNMFIKELLRVIIMSWTFLLEETKWNLYYKYLSTTLILFFNNTDYLWLYY